MTEPISPTPIGAASDHAAIARRAGVAASLGAALLYLLIGVGVLDIGESTLDGSAQDLLGFGAVMAIASAGSALVIWRAHARLLLGLVAVLQVIVLVGYLALAGIRDPSFELWGLLANAFQVITLVAVAYLILRDRPTTATPPGLPKGHAA